MMPVVSYKVPNVDTAGTGGYDAWVATAKKNLESFGKKTVVAVHHEPHGDMTPAQYVKMNERMLPLFRSPLLKVGPILNGWLLDKQVAVFDSYTSPALFSIYDYFAIDTYEGGTIDAPALPKPADRIPLLVKYLASKGRSDLRIGVGEYNGYSYDTIKAAGDAILSTPQVWFGCMWNSTIGKGYVLTGDRLRAFKETLADPRAVK
jgi:hypothetical protein